MSQTPNERNEGRSLTIPGEAKSEKRSKRYQEQGFRGLHSGFLIL